MGLGTHVPSDVPVYNGFVENYQNIAEWTERMHIDNKKRVFFYFWHACDILELLVMKMHSQKSIIFLILLDLFQCIFETRCTFLTSDVTPEKNSNFHCSEKQQLRLRNRVFSKSTKGIFASMLVLVFCHL